MIKELGKIAMGVLLALAAVKFMPAGVKKYFA